MPTPRHKLTRLLLAVTLTTSNWALAKTADKEPAVEAAQAEPKTAAKVAVVETRDELDDSGWLLVPVVGFSPETDLQLGALVVHHFRLDVSSRTSSIPLLLIGTTRKQLLVEFQPELYWSDDDYRFWMWIEGQRYPDSFFGTGNDVSNASEERYNRIYFRSRINFRRRIVSQLYGGVIADQVWARLDDLEPGGLLESGEYRGSKGGLSSGLGVALAWDGRDSRTYPTRNTYAELQFAGYQRWLGSEYPFAWFKLDARHYFPLGAQRVLALRYVTEQTFGQPPFYQLPQFGGANSMRGYFFGKYRDDAVHFAEAEYRTPVYWRFGAALFAGIGQVGENYGKLWRSPVRPAVGAGLRFNVGDEEIFNMRVDVGYWPDNFGVYVSVLEIF